MHVRKKAPKRDREGNSEAKSIWPLFCVFPSKGRGKSSDLPSERWVCLRKGNQRGVHAHPKEKKKKGERPDLSEGRNRNWFKGEKKKEKSGACSGGNRMTKGTGQTNRSEFGSIGTHVKKKKPLTKGRISRAMKESEGEKKKD